MNVTKKLSEKEVQELITRIAKKLETLKDKYPHFKKFNLKEAIGKNYISYRHHIQWKPNPNYEKEMKELEKEVPYAKAHEPQKEIAVYPEKDGISVDIDFHSDEEPRSARVVLNPLRIGNTTVEFEVTGAETKKIEEIRAFILKTLEEEKSAFESASSQPKIIQRKDFKIEFSSDAPLKIINTSKDVLAFYDHSEYQYGSFLVKEGKLYHDELAQMQGELKHYNFLRPQQTMQRSFSMASNGKVTIEYVKINKLNLKSVFIFESQTKETLEEAHPKRLPYRNPKTLKELEKVKEGIVWQLPILREEFDSPILPPQKVLSPLEKKYPMVDPRFFDLMKGDKNIEIWINPSEGYISQFFHYGEDLRKTQPMDDQRYHGFAAHKILLPPHQGRHFLDCLKTGGYELKWESDVITSEFRVYRSAHPLTKEQIDKQMQDMGMRNTIQLMVPPPSERGAKPKIIAFDDPKKREALYQSQDRNEQEKILLEMARSLEERNAPAIKYTEEQFRKAQEAFKKQCEEMIEEAKKKVSDGQDKQTVFDQTVKALRDLEEQKRLSWKGRSVGNVNDYLQKLEKEFK